MKLLTRRLLVARLCCAALLVSCTATYSAACDPTRQSCAPTEGAGGGAGEGGAQSCSPSPGGSTCDGSGPASQGNASGTNQGAGNPINLINGNKYQQEVDMPALPGILGLEIVRHYNSQYSLPNVPNGILGRGWKLSYESELYDTPVGVQIVQADGTRLIFQRSKGDASHCTSTNPANGSVTIVDKPRGKEYVWRWPNGRELQFNAQRKLVQIAAATGEFVTLGYDPKGWLIYVRDPQGRELRLSYATASQDGTQRFRGVQSIASPVGRYTYAYGSPLPAGSQAPPRLLLSNLTRVGIPAGQAPTSGPGDLTRQYHYEDPKFPTLLTGISVQGSGSDGVQMSQRISTYGYDNQGKAILSQKAQGIEKITLDTNTPRQTILTNSLGQKTTYLHANIAGQWRLLQSRGAGCASCGPANVRYAYDNVGRLTEQTTLDAAGQPLAGTRTTVDAQGRPVRVERVRYARGKAGVAELLLRYEYQGDAPSPTLIARPSVVAGKEHQTHITYNARGQPSEITEAGYEPVNQSPIQRSTRYTYQTINGRSVLQSIDGPLPNGPQGTPQDSDITTLQWDRTASFITRRTDPGNILVDLAHDDAGRIVQTTMDDGFRQVRTETRYAQMGAIARQAEADAQTAWLLEAGQPKQASKLQRQTMQLRFDALGRHTQTIDSAGRLSTRHYDAAGRMLGISDAQGYKSQLTLDTEGKTRVAGLYKPGQSDQPYRAIYQWHDELARLTERLLPDGRLDSWRYAANGSLQQHTDGFDTRTSYLQTAGRAAQIAQTPDGWLRATAFGNRSGADANAVLADDFGRVVRQNLRDHGQKNARYDEADRLLQITNADGSHTRYGWDTAGRLLKKSYVDANDQLLAQTTLIYQGRLLVQAQDPAQTTTYRYDALGRPTDEAVTLAGLSVPLRTATAYDEHTGLIQARTLADGRVLRTRRTDAQHGASPQALTLQSVWAAWVQDGIERIVPPSLAQTLLQALPAQAVAHDIEIDPLDGLTGYTAGNGLKTTRAFDLAGRLVELKTEKISAMTYRYGVGPRIRAIERQEPDQPGLVKTSYDYQGFGRLVPQGAPARMVKTAQRQVEPPQRDEQGRFTHDGRLRYTYTPAGLVETVSTSGGQLLATYTYNSLRQRVKKTTAQGNVVYYLWQQGKLVAEIDREGSIQTQYLYFAEGQRSQPIAKLESNAGTEVAYFVHADHRGAPLAMTDAQQKIVWRAPEADAWGMVNASGRAKEDQNQATLNIRLPGQYYDQETGLHDNWRRTYDPQTGRYLQPDPLGYPDGPDAYLYAGGDPVNSTDSTGLYQEDVHYYMTYFLARLAGIETEEALTIALAAQFIDDNSTTGPLSIGSTNSHIDRLSKYHFTQEGYDPPRLSGESDVAYALRRVSSPKNPQLDRLQSASNRAPNRCSRAQLFGEFLHAYEDTFAHRTDTNEPIATNGGLGHGIYGEHPDYTYNHIGGGNWIYQEQRSLEMEKSTLARLSAYSGKLLWNSATGKSLPISWSDMFGNGLDTDSGLLQTWNKQKSKTEKIFWLDQELNDLGLGALPIYDENEARSRRTKNLQGLNMNDYPGVILTTEYK
jgi:RHS repeat-associated protein